MKYMVVFNILQYWNITNCWDLLSWETRKCTLETDNLLRPSDAIWWIKFGSKLAQVMAHCLMAPSHYLTQCWVIISETLWHWTERNLTRNVQDIYPWYEFQYFKLPHWNQVTHICVSKLAIIGSDNGLLLRLRQAIILTNARILLIPPLGTFPLKFLLEFKHFDSRKCSWKCNLQNVIHFVLASIYWR